MADLLRGGDDLSDFDGHEAILSRCGCAAGLSVTVSPCSVKRGIDDEAALAIVAGHAPGRRRAPRRACRRQALRPRPSRGGRRGRCRDRARSPGGARSPASSQSTALAISVAAASAVAASAASTVTESAMPSEKERPRAPDVAMPPTPSPWRMRIEPLRAGTGPEREIAGNRDVEALARRAEDGDVAAVVDVGAVERRGGAHHRHQLVGDRAGHRRHRRDEDFRETARRPSPCAARPGFAARPCRRAREATAARRKARAGSSRSAAPPPDAPRTASGPCRTPSAPRRSARATDAGVRRSAPGR